MLRGEEDGNRLMANMVDKAGLNAWVLRSKPDSLTIVFSYADATVFIASSQECAPAFKNPVDAFAITEHNQRASILVRQAR